MEFFSSLESAQKGFDSAIKLLTELKSYLTKENFSHYSININQKRDLEPIRTIGLGVVGFRQMSPVTSTIIVDDSQDLGKELIARKGPWESPSTKEMSDLNKKLSNRNKTKGWKKFKSKKK